LRMKAQRVDELSAGEVWSGSALKRGRLGGGDGGIR